MQASQRSSSTSATHHVQQNVSFISSEFHLIQRAASRVELLSPWATADPLLLLGSDTPLVLEKRLIELLDVESARVEIASYFKNAGIDWTYSVSSSSPKCAIMSRSDPRRGI